MTRSRVTGDASPCGGPATPLYRDSSVIVLDNLGPRAQRRGRHVAGTAAHPTRFPPDLAAFLIDGYSWPGHLVLDPLAGTGTALVEAVYLGRNAIGLADDPGWAAIARANLALARRQGAAGAGRVTTADPARLVTRRG